MILVVQRVKSAFVKVGDEEVARIGNGLLVFGAVERDDTEAEIEWCAKKVSEIRIFPDDEDKMNRNVKDAGGEVLAVSQFTLAGDLRKGTRPSFSNAAPPETAKPFFDLFVRRIEKEGLKVSTGVFQAMMDVGLVNDGPVTIILQRSNKEKSHAQN
jgi:D-aminoacyl-tRNA deacylase